MRVLAAAGAVVAMRVLAPAGAVVSAIVPVRVGAAASGIVAVGVPTLAGAVVPVRMGAAAAAVPLRVVATARSVMSVIVAAALGRRLRRSAAAHVAMRVRVQRARLTSARRASARLDPAGRRGGSSGGGGGGREHAPRQHLGPDVDLHAAHAAAHPLALDGCEPLHRLWLGAERLREVEESGGDRVRREALHRSCKLHHPLRRAGRLADHLSTDVQP
mmetsp:Transcript_41184/g.136483  ORF Transcript_41184/g.136483 Transcript_41184/m.136483 type:complete len:217 (+) Transcript_41184:285-935(+)